MHPEAYDFVARTVQRLPPRTRVLEIGSRDINGSVRPLFSAAEVYVGVDLVDGPGVDAVADASHSGALCAAIGRVHPDPLRGFDTVVSCEVLEHADIAPGICSNAIRQLIPGGYFIMTCATDPREPHSAVDGGNLRPGEFYRNVSPDRFEEWMALIGTNIVERIETHPRGDLYAVVRRLS